MANISNDTAMIDPACPYRQWYADAGHLASFIAYYIASPIYFVLGILGHGLCLKAFYTQSKNEHAYMYQVYTTLSELVEVLCWMVYVIMFEWLAAPQESGPHWYRSSYWAMWFSAMFGTTLINMLITTSELFSICMSADRLYALWKPFSYKSAKNKRNQAIAVGLCVSIGVLTSIFQCFCFDVDADFVGPDGIIIYKLIFVAFKYHWFEYASQFRNVIQALGLVALYACNVGLVWFYRKRTKEASKLLNLSSKEKKRQENERTLLLLTVCQCLCMTINMTSQISFVVVVFFYPTFYGCSGPFYMPIRDAFFHIVDLLDFFGAAVISKSFRVMIMKELRCCKKPSAVNTMSVSPANISMREIAVREYQ